MIYLTLISAVVAGLVCLCLGIRERILWDQRHHSQCGTVEQSRIVRQGKVASCFQALILFGTATGWVVLGSENFLFNNICLGVGVCPLLYFVTSMTKKKEKCNE